MEPALFTSLLHRVESDTLEFKADFYSLDNDDEKGEFLKDLLAFINAWRNTDAYILMGVSESDGGIANVGGITKQRDDNVLQTLARGKITPQPRFAYEVHVHEGKSCGVIHIPVQKRPAYLPKPFGKLRENTVYIRRGSSTSTASPDEIIEIASAANGSKQAQFLILAQPRLWKEGIGHTFSLLMWLKNVGEATAENITVDIKANHYPNPNPNHWSVDRTMGILRMVSLKPLHIEEDILMGTWRLAHIASEEEIVPPNAYRGDSIKVSVVVRIKDKRPFSFGFEFTKEQIHAREYKEIKPVIEP